jgi:hypothetical protein
VGVELAVMGEEDDKEEEEETRSLPFLPTWTFPCSFD